MQDERTIESLLDTQQKKLAFFQNLILVAAADGVLENDESRFLLEIGNKLNLTPEEVMPIADNLHLLSFIIPAEGLQKTMELQTLVQMMLEDGKIHDREYSLCQEYAHRIGFAKSILDDMIKQLSGNKTAIR
ncbi:MAG: hypothetical protein JWQ14_2492 [Adhaeribacter sp.]|nr:hypothetical protein [Adhaeribacter sp.]